MLIRNTQTLMLAGLISLAGLEVAQANCGATANPEQIACDGLLAAASGNAATQPAHVAAPSATAPVPNGQQPGTRTPLGDLSGFRAIAVDTLTIVKTGDFGAAKKRIKDLELSWDQAEPKLKPLAPEKWQTIDAAIDHALKEVRAWRTTPAASSEVLQALIAAIDSLK